MKIHPSREHEIVNKGGGTLYKNYLRPEETAKHADTVLRIQKVLGETAFYTPLFRRYANSPQFPLMLISKAWLSLGNPAAVQTGISVLNSIQEPLEAIDSIQALTELADSIDDDMASISKDRCLQIYQPSGTMMPHIDAEASVRIVNLAGDAEVRWHDPETDDIVERTRLQPGDLLHLDGSHTHSVRNIGSDMRIMMGLIDEQL